MRLKGLGVSPGVGVGTRGRAPRARNGDFGFSIPARRVPREVERLQAAREARPRADPHIKERIAAAPAPSTPTSSTPSC